MPVFPPKRKPPPHRGLAAVDLFSGMGGLSLGLRQAGFSIRGAIESDELAVEGYRENHREAWVWNEEIQEVAPSDVLRRLCLRKGQLPLLAACPPCEGFSRLRTKNGRHDVEDKRNDLITEVERFAIGMQPWAIMLENVPGLAGDGRFEAFVQALHRMRYEVKWKVLDAADYGVPQRRKRLILLASRFADWRFPSPSPDRPTVADVIRELPLVGTSGDLAHDTEMQNSERIRDLIRGIPKNGGSRLDLPKDQQLDCHRDFDGFKDVYGRMAWDALAPTITGGCASPSKGRFLHPEEDRVISLREAALLQSFPPDYVIPMRRGRYAAAELIGNALPPEMIRRIASPHRRDLAKEASRRRRRACRRAARGARVA